MQCPNCGAENEFEGAAFCRSCREPLNAEPADGKGDSDEARQGTDLNLQTSPDANQQGPSAIEPSYGGADEGLAGSEDSKQDKPPEPSQEQPTQYEPLKAGPIENKGESEDTNKETASEQEMAQEPNPLPPAQYGPSDDVPVESKDDSEEGKAEAESRQEKPQEPSQAEPSNYEPLKVGPVQGQAGSEESKPEMESTREEPPEPTQAQPSRYEPLNTGPVGSKSDSEVTRQEPVSDQDKSPDSEQQDPDDEQLKLSDPIDFMINEVPDDSSYYTGGSEKDTSGGITGDKPADSPEDEFRLSISGGAVGSSVKLEEAINKAIAEMNLAVNDPEQKNESDDPKSESTQNPPAETAEKTDRGHETGSDVPDRKEPQPTTIEPAGGDPSETTEAKQEDSRKEQEIAPEAPPQETAQRPSGEAGDQKPLQQAGIQAHAEIEQRESPMGPHVSQTSPTATAVETREQITAERGEYPNQQTPPTEKLSPTDKWNSVLSIKPKAPAAGGIGVKDLPEVSQSKGVILLSGNNLILAGGRKVVSGDEVRIGDQLYEVKIKPEDKKRKFMIGAAAAAAVLIILIAIFAGGGDGRLVGILVDNHGNYPIAERTVRIAELNKSVQTNLAGFFTFDDLSPGLYTLQYMNNGTVASEVKIAILRGDLTTVTLHTEESEGRIPSR